MSRLRVQRVSFFAPAVWRRFLIAFFSAALVLWIIDVAIYRQDVVHQRVLFEQEAQHMAELQQELIEFEFGAVQSDLRFLATQDALSRFLAGDTSARSMLEREYASFAKNKGVYDQIRCLDVAGQEIIRINSRDQDAEIVPQEQLQSKATRYYFQQALSFGGGEVFVSPFDLNVEHGEIQRPIKPVIRFVTGVFNDAGENSGLLVLNYLGEHLLSKLRQLALGFRGETMLVNSDGEYLQSPIRDHEWGWLLGHEHSFRTDFSEAWEQFTRSNETQFRVGQSLFLFRRVFPDRESIGMWTPESTSTQMQDSGSLILVTYVSPAVAKAHSSQLLEQLMLLSLGVLAVVAVPLTYWAHAGQVRRYHEQSIATSEARLRQLSSLLLAAQETERRNLSRDLHDELGQLVTALSLDLRLMEKMAGSAPANPLLQRAIAEADQLLSSLHEVATRVRPSVLDDLGLGDAVESFLSEYRQRTEIEVVSSLQLNREAIPGIVAENAYRILQEALANVAAHAQADRVEVIIIASQDVLRMTIRDSGIGFDAKQLEESARLGILGMRERVELLNGRFDLQTARGRGTEIQVMIPLTDHPQIAKSSDL